MTGYAVQGRDGEIGKVREFYFATNAGPSGILRRMPEVGWGNGGT